MGIKIFKIFAIYKIKFYHLKKKPHDAEVIVEESIEADNEVF